MNYKSGFISIIGRPNAGKSTLINRFVGEKVSIVSFRPQTTRNIILGIVNGDNYQAVFIDTPGILDNKNKLSQYMQRNINNSLSETDVVLYLIDGNKNIDDRDKEFIDRYSQAVPLIVVVNKVDEAKIETVAGTLLRLNEFNNVKAVYPISARKGHNCEKLLEEIISLLPEGDKLYPEDMYTDRTVRFLVSEMIREKAFLYLNEEIPYGISVVINSLKEREDKEIVNIIADIVCEKDAHKSIIIGKNGAMIKRIGEAARRDIEKLLDKKVYLMLYAKVEKDWRDNLRLLADLGYGQNTQ